MMAGRITADLLLAGGGFGSASLTARNWAPSDTRGDGAAFSFASTFGSISIDPLALSPLRVPRCERGCGNQKIDRLDAGAHDEFRELCVGASATHCALSSFM